MGPKKTGGDAHRLMRLEVMADGETMKRISVAQIQMAAQFNLHRLPRREVVRRLILLGLDAMEERKES